MSGRRGRIVAAASLILLASFAIDQPVAQWMAGASPLTLRVFAFITWFGQGGVILYPAAVVALAATVVAWRSPERRRRARLTVRRAVAIFAVVALAGLANDMLKVAFGRARPHLWLAGDNSGFRFLRYGANFASFPSGHTATSVAAALVLSELYPRGRWAFAAFAILIGVSRIAIDAHYVSDVIAGAIVGGVVALKMLDQTRESGWTRSRRGEDGRDLHATHSAR